MDCIPRPNASMHRLTPMLAAITGKRTYGELQSGWIVRATGTGSGDVYTDDVGYVAGTHCGSIVTTQMDTYQSAEPWGWGIKVDICSRDGDSGGPLFNQVDHMAYGILSGGPPRDDGRNPFGPCDLSQPWEYSVYTSIDEDLKQATSQTGVTMSLITTPNG
jgi:streptogrisin C